MKFVVKFWANIEWNNGESVMNRQDQEICHLADKHQRTHSNYVEMTVDGCHLDEVLQLLEESERNFIYEEEMEEEDNYPLCSKEDIEECITDTNLELNVPEYIYFTLEQWCSKGLIMPNLNTWAIDYYESFKSAPWMSDLKNFMNYLYNEYVVE